MTQESQTHLPRVLNGISKKIFSLFFKKLILYDSQILEAKHLRHYDNQCEGLVSLINFFQRKINKYELYAFQMLKDPHSVTSEEGQFIRQDEFKEQQKQVLLKNLEENATPRTKFFTRANTSIEESDNSFIFSPNVKKNIKTACKTQYFGSSFNVGEQRGEQRNEILQNLLHRVKKVNTETYQQSLNPAKSSYFNLTLGKQSLQTFQNNCHCDCLHSNCKKQLKQTKRRKILEKFENIERKIYQEPQVYTSNYMTPRASEKTPRVTYMLPQQNYMTPKPKNYVKNPKVSHTAYSVHEPMVFQEMPGDVVYVTRGKNEAYNQYGSSLSSSKSVTHINYARQVYI